MKKYSFFKSLTIVILSIALFSCKGGNKSEAEIKDAEVLPDDIVELRDDQVKLAQIETGTVELRALSGTIKASGTVTTSPQNLATVSFPMGRIYKKFFISGR